MIYDSVIDSYTGLRWCGRGLHLMDEANTRTRPSGGRSCKKCEARLLRQKRARARQGKAPPAPS